VRGEVAIISVIFVSMMLFSAMVQVGEESISFDSEIFITNGTDSMDVSVDYWIGETRFSKAITVLCFPLTEERSDDIYIYNDYLGLNGTFYPLIAGLYDHLRAILEVYEYPGKVRMVGPESLDGIFVGPNATLILASQPLGGEDLAEKALEWVRGGGVIIGIGSSIPFVHDGTSSAPEGFLELRYQSMDFDGGRDMIETQVAKAFDLETVAPSKGIVVEDVLAINGSVVGYIYQREGELTSAALFQVGEGRVLALSGDLVLPSMTSGEDAVSRDIARLVASGFLWSTGSPVLEERVGGAKTMSGTLNATFLPSPYLSFASFDRDHFQDFFYSRIVLTR